jgi:DNA invertase Pin-like site-specific DNA recombinase
MPTHVIYARKSTESEDRQVLSIDSQVQELKLLALRRGLEVDEVLTEAHSAKAPGRPVFGQLMKRVAKGEIGAVLCWKMDRLARNHLDTGHVLQALADGKLPRVITPEREYTADGNDRFLGNFEFGIATKFIDDLRANVKRGNRARFQRGWPNYRPALGYLEDHGTKTIVKDPVRFPLVRKMWDLLLSGAMRPSQILRVANEDLGLRTRKTAQKGGNPLRFQHIYKIFSNPYYMGLIRLRSGEVYRGAHEPMISPEEFEAGQRILGRPGRPRPSRHEFAYAGMIVCARCGGVLTPERHTKPSGRVYTYYRCRARVGKSACAVRTLPESALDARILADLQRLAVSRPTAAWMVEHLRGSLGQDLAQRHAARRSLQQAFQHAMQEGETLLTLRLRSQVDEGTFERRRKELLERQATLRLRLDQPETQPDQIVQRVQEILDFARTAPAAFQSSAGDSVRRRLIVQAVTANLRADDGVPLYSAKKPFSFLTQTGKIRPWLAVVHDLRTWLSETQCFEPIPNLANAPTLPQTSNAA